MPPATQLLTVAEELARLLENPGGQKILPTPRRIRLLLGGQYIADSLEALAVWEHAHYPQYYLPTEAFQSKYITEGAQIMSSDGKRAVARIWSINVNGASTDRAFEVLDGKLKGYVKVYFDAIGMFRQSTLRLDHWLEEDTPILVHPKDPFKRLDLLASRRRIRVSVHGQVVADTDYSIHLYETGLPARYYIPLTAVDQTVLRPSTTISQCAYKGRAEYYSVVTKDGQESKDIVWYYYRPLVEAAAVAGLVCFWNEKVEIEIDGNTEEQPVTHFFT